MTPQRTAHDQAVEFDTTYGRPACPDCGSCSYHDNCERDDEPGTCETCSACAQCIAECRAWRSESTYRPEGTDQ